jgi:hypothetical protein
MQRLLIIIGATVLVAGLAWPWLSRIGLGSLPGDIRIERDGFVLYLPLTSCLLVSILISVIVWLLRR